MYQRECNKPEKIIWRCVQYKQKCRGRVHVSNGEIIKYTDHNHIPDISKIEAKIQVNEMKEKARSTCESTHSVLGTIAQVEMSVAGQLPSIASLKRTIQRVRQTELSAPSNPVDFNFDIPEKFHLTTDGELFLQYDSGSNDSKRILIFATNRNFELMENSEHWFCDGTFSSATSIFSQLYIPFMEYIIQT
ncbi:unnamed protein product [Macrosiphum euphorbiae]|nr:unnamed protein product [Macrosiphum euphorbiae]